MDGFLIKESESKVSDFCIANSRKMAKLFPIS